MRRWVLIAGSAILTVVLFFWVNTGYKMIDMSSLDVTVSPTLSLDSVRITRGFYSINRMHDMELFADTRKGRLIFNGHQVGALDTDYGENDFLITYGGRFYFQFRHFIFNSNNQHDYEFTIERRHHALYLTVNIDGPDAMSFARPMALISDAQGLRCNSPIDSTKVIYNMVEME